MTRSEIVMEAQLERWRWGHFESPKQLRSKYHERRKDYAFLAELEASVCAGFIVLLVLKLMHHVD